MEENSLGLQPLPPGLDITIIARFMERVTLLLDVLRRDLDRLSAAQVDSSHVDGLQLQVKALISSGEELQRALRDAETRIVEHANQRISDLGLANLREELAVLQNRVTTLEARQQTFEVDSGTLLKRVGAHVAVKGAAGGAGVVSVLILLLYFVYYLITGHAPPAALPGVTP